MHRIPILSDLAAPYLNYSKTSYVEIKRTLNDKICVHKNDYVELIEAKRFEIRNNHRRYAEESKSVRFLGKRKRRRILGTTARSSPQQVQMAPQRD